MDCKGMSSLTLWTPCPVGNQGRALCSTASRARALVAHVCEQFQDGRLIQRKTVSLMGFFLGPREGV